MQEAGIENNEAAKRVEEALLYAITPHDDGTLTVTIDNNRATKKLWPQLIYCGQ